MGKAQRQKGKAGEREVAKIMREHGFEDAHRTQQYSGEGAADVEGLPGFHVEVKRQEQCRIKDWLQQATRDAESGDVPLVVWRASRQDWVAFTPFERLLDVIHELVELREENEHLRLMCDSYEDMVSDLMVDDLR